MHTSLSLHFIAVQCLDMFRVLLAHPQEALNGAELVAILCVRVEPPEDGRVMPETCRDIEHK
jgi:hypothetical protein